MVINNQMRGEVILQSILTSLLASMCLYGFFITDTAPFIHYEYVPSLKGKCLLIFPQMNYR